MVVRLLLALDMQQGSLPEKDSTIPTNEANTIKHFIGMVGCVAEVEGAAVVGASVALVGRS